MMAITTKSSISVKAGRRLGEVDMARPQTGRPRERGAPRQKRGARPHRHGSRRLFSPVRLPLKASRSTLPLTPGQEPVEVYCQKVKKGHAAGTKLAGLPEPQ